MRKYQVEVAYGLPNDTYDPDNLPYLKTYKTQILADSIVEAKTIVINQLKLEIPDAIDIEVLYTGTISY